MVTSIYIFRNLVKNSWPKNDPKMTINSLRFGQLIFSILNATWTKALFGVFSGHFRAFPGLFRAFFGPFSVHFRVYFSRWHFCSLFRRFLLDFFWRTILHFWTKKTQTKKIKILKMAKKADFYPIFDDFYYPYFEMYLKKRPFGGPRTRFLACQIFTICACFSLVFVL